MIVVQCNIVSQAVLRRSREELIKAIDGAPRLINEPNSFGQTPLHLSVGWLPGLEILLKAGADPDLLDQCQSPPIFYAVSNDDVPSVRLLAKADYDLDLLRDKIFDWRDILQFALVVPLPSRDGDSKRTHDHEMLIDVIIEFLSMERRRLRELASFALPASIVKALALSEEKLLDAQVPCCLATLRESEIFVPLACLQSPYLFNEGYVPVFVYHIYYLTAGVAQKLWEAGFRDVEAVDDNGNTPLLAKSSGYFYTTDRGYRELISWFISKGADVHCTQRKIYRCRHADKFEIYQTKSKSSTTALHYIACSVSGFIHHSFDVKINKKAVRSAIQDIFQSPLRDIFIDKVQDTCMCACSRGCSPIIMFLKGIDMDSIQSIRLPWKVGLRISLNCCIQICAILAEYLEPQAQAYCGLISSQSLRFLTFKKLSLRHTCCRWQRYWAEAANSNVIFELDEDEIHEIQDEDRELIDKLEELLEEFQVKYEELGVSMKEFLHGYWQTRMDEVLSEQEVLNEDELRRIGVVVHPAESDSDVEGGYDVDSTSDDDG
ncbi:hypothetical protein MMC20_001923 [Loxospora ochrophaea]|nr:hypothetical protein [Loxospora ochrophaea]